MAPPTWLPPLNSHEHYRINVRAFETNQNDLHEPTSEPEFLIKLAVIVDFRGEHIRKDDMISRGLNLEIEIPIPRDVDPENLPGLIRQEIINDDFVPFLLNRCHWKEDRFSSERICPWWVSIASEEELLTRISNYLLYLNRKPNNKDRRIVPVVLEIHKLVAVPEGELRSWISWYDERKRADPDFERDYADAIGRPRSEVELLEEEDGAAGKSAAVEGLESVVYEDKNDEKACCIICLEGILSGTLVTRLPCLHVYHGDCVGRWLRKRHVCPLCRYQLRAVDILSCAD